MRRFNLREIHDNPHFPAHLRDMMTDALEAVWAFADTYKPILPILCAAMERAGSLKILDLCSGGGGPLLRLGQDMEQDRSLPVRVQLTDKYPNRGAFQRAQADLHNVTGMKDPVDALHVPTEIEGFRTIFSSFHHFSPTETRQILAGAAASGSGIGIFEAARREPRTLLTIFVLPALVWMVTPRIRPFRWARIFWTYLVPVVPFVIWYDGLASCLRAYSHAELRAMTSDLAAEGYCWSVGEARTGWLPITYLIGYPTRD